MQSAGSLPRCRTWASATPTPLLLHERHSRESGNPLRQRSAPPTISHLPDYVLQEYLATDYPRTTSRKIL